MVNKNNNIKNKFENINNKIINKLSWNNNNNIHQLLMATTVTADDDRHYDASCNTRASHEWFYNFFFIYKFEWRFHFIFIYIYRDRIHVIVNNIILGREMYTQILRMHNDIGTCGSHYWLWTCLYIRACFGF